ncbi:hypothetical protein Asi02nite_54190 [Asanoa siamensis]|uniref:PknH-like extracellular domain-containing protein n=1 Tax=Asanoa siamensis TaxID=926357 RepID=A0ABQ4CX81_9ACTN|nr:hypothetical protein Asi02nite_54190 [Asanoa siamensis]
MLVSLLVVAAGLAGCVAEPPPPAPAPPVSPAPSPSTSGPEALMATIGQAIEDAAFGEDVRLGEIDDGRTSYAPCDLLVVEPDKANWLKLESDWSSGLEVNPVSSFGSLHGPKTVMDVKVFHLKDAAAAEAAATKARTAPCSRADAPLSIGFATAKRGSRTVEVGATPARLTTMTLKDVKPEADYLPGDARVTFARGPLLISVEAVAFRSRKANAPTDITAAAEAKAMTTAIALTKALPPA